MKWTRPVVVIVVLAAMGIPLAGWAAKDGAKVRRVKPVAQPQAKAHKVKAEKAEKAEKAGGKSDEQKNAKAEARKAKAEAAKQERETKKEAATTQRGERVDNRQDNQSRRIEHGIKKGYLTAGEISTLQTQQNSIAQLESSFRSDGRLTGKEMQSLRTELNTASRCIWAEKHDTDGNQMATYRLGNNVFAKNDFTAKMGDPNLSATEAKALCKDFRRLTELKRSLSGDLPEAQRTSLQTEYNQLLNQYFEVR